MNLIQNVDKISTPYVYNDEDNKLMMHHVSQVNNYQSNQETNMNSHRVISSSQVHYNNGAHHSGVFSPLSYNKPNINAEINNYIDQNSNVVMSVTSLGQIEGEDTSAMEFSNHKQRGNL